MIIDKLNFLMLLTNTTNGLLADAVCYDVSYISKIRTGKRKVPQVPAFYSAAAVYFASRITELKKESSASAVLYDSAPWPQDPESAARIISSWLLADTDQLSKQLRNCLTEIAPEEVSADTAFVPEPDVPAGDGANSDFSAAESVQTFFGNEGKREGILRCLLTLCRKPVAYDILCYSDEPLDWFTEDRTFFEKWKTCLLQLIKSGSTIKIINRIDRNTDEMKEGLRMWAPIMLTGAVHSFYSSTPSAHVYDRSLFIARGTVAFTCNALRLSNYYAVNTLYSQKKAVETFEKEFDSLLARCIPLARLFTPENRRELSELHLHFETAEANRIHGTSAPSLFSLPADTASRIAERTGCPGLLSETIASGISFRQLMIRNCTATDIIILPKKEELLSGKVPLPFRTVLGSSNLFYRPEEYLEHLEHTLLLASENKKYSPIACTGAGLPEHIFLLFKQKKGLFFGVSLPEERILYFDEPSILAPFGSFLLRFIGVSNFRTVNELRLKRYIADVRKSLVHK